MKNKILILEIINYFKDRKKYFLIPIFILLFLSNFVIADINIESPYEHYNMDSGYSAKTGYKFIMNENSTLKSVNRDVLADQLTTTYILNSSKDILYQADFVNDTSTFSPSINLTKGKSYYVAFDRNGGDSYSLYRNTTASYPVNKSLLNYTAGLRQSAGQSQDTLFFGFNLDFMTFTEDNTEPIINSIIPNTTQQIIRGNNISFSLNITDNEGDSTVQWFLNNTLVVANNTNYLLESKNNLSGNYEVYANVYDSEYSINSTKIIIEVEPLDYEAPILEYLNFETFITFDKDNTTHYLDSVNDNHLIVTGGAVNTGITIKNDSVNLNNVNLQSNNFSFLVGEPSSIGFWVHSTGQFNFMSSGVDTLTSPRTINQMRTSYLLDGNGIDGLAPIHQGLNKDTHFLSVWNGSTSTFYVNGEIAKSLSHDILLLHYDSALLNFNTFLNGNSVNSIYDFGDVGGITLIGDVYIDDFFVYNGVMNGTQTQDIMSGSIEYINSLEYAPQDFTITKPNQSFVLNSTGRNIYFEYTNSQGNPTPIYDVYLTNGIVNFPIRINTSLTSFIESISSTDIPLVDLYNINVRAHNTLGEIIKNSTYQIGICINSWQEQYTSCINDSQIKTYIDSNLCIEQYDIPLDHNISIVCDDGILSESELNERTLKVKEDWFKMSMLLIILILAFVIRILNDKMFIPYIFLMVISALGFVFYFPEFKIVGIVIFIITAIDLIYNFRQGD